MSHIAAAQYISLSVLTQPLEIKALKTIGMIFALYSDVLIKSHRTRTLKVPIHE